ncbi:unnamed protein product [Dibothriocephalus latus]|uniref:Uncharacterized protein n=1 Tax=Dibothriocephalus latus TaxID=60516 RepID=A0A3P6S4F5_DIBLA|nr:unnamed protein product [Dibothriocephalus latus]
MLGRFDSSRPTACYEDEPVEVAPEPVTTESSSTVSSAVVTTAVSVAAGARPKPLTPSTSQVRIGMRSLRLLTN